MIKKWLKRLVPERVLGWYHYLLALVATIYYGFPAQKLVIIGVTGTKGKTSVANFIWAVLQAGGYKTGIITTANVRIGEQEFMNHRHMTMPGRFVIQKLLAEMVAAGCHYCVVETTSQGLKQYRHVGVSYDVAIFTNLSPEHLSAHGGSLEKYKEAKGVMFEALAAKRKVLDGVPVPKVIIVNRDSDFADYYLHFPADKKITFAVERRADYVARNIQETTTGVNFDVDKIMFQLAILGKFNVYNALPAVIVGRELGLASTTIARGLLALTTIPGRMERIETGRPPAGGFTVLVDYAHERLSMTNLLQTANNLKGAGARVIVLFGAEGGGREKVKRSDLGEVAAKGADYVIASTTDPYDDDPEEILEEIAGAAEKFGKVRGENLFVCVDRREGIRKALQLAKPGDIVLICGKGAEQTMMVAGGQALPWDDRKVVKEELAALGGRGYGREFPTGSF